jgi:hypothetical protein
MDAREFVLTKHLKAHDSELFCKRAGLEGPHCVYRKVTRWDEVPVDGGTLKYSRPSQEFIFALTEDWTLNGKPTEWGIEPVLDRIKHGDLWNRPHLVEDLIGSYERASETKARHLSSQTEDFLKDFRPQFAKAFNDINTSTLEKVDSRRKKNGS